jgi:uncharacterized protein YndB with AHSA1/START domain
MDHMREEVLIEAPVEHVWALLCDVSRLKEWVPRADAYDWTGPYDQVGTTYVESVKFMGFENKSTYTVVEVEPLKLIHEHTDNGPIDNYIRLEQEDGAVRFIMESDYVTPAHLPEFITRIFTKSFMERQVRHMLADFKAIAEATVPVLV